MNQKSWELYSQILSQESVSLEYSKYADTASFNLEDRKITLPLFEYMTDDVTQLLVSHEIGHALHSTYTTQEFKEYVEKYFDLFNIVEDAHVENRLKKSFNGLKSIFKDGYKTLNENDFFGISEIENLTTLALSSRLNLFYKIGHVVNVPFDGRENEFAMRLKFISSKEEVIKLCDDILEYLKEESKNKNNDSSEETENGGNLISSEEEIQGIGEENSTTFSKESLVSSKDESSNNRKEISNDETLNEVIKQELTDIVGKNFNSKLIEYGEQQRMENSINEDNPTISFDSKFAFENAIDYTKLYPAIRAASSQFINSPTCKKTVKEIKNLARSADIVFQQRKKAEELKNTRHIQVGRLDVKKLSKHRVSDNIFAKNKIIKEGKNHGIVICVDYSGSMKKFLKDTITQACILGEFCKLNNIPFAIIAFGITSSVYYDGHEWTKHIAILGNQERFDIESILYLTYKNRLPVMFNGNYHNFIQFNTPTIDGLLAASYIIEGFKKCGVDKTSLFLVTDGYHTGSAILKDCGQRSSLHKVSSITVDNVLYSIKNIFRERTKHYDWIIELLCLNLKKRFDTFISISHLGIFDNLYKSLSGVILSKFPTIQKTAYNYHYRDNDEFLFLWKHGYYFEDCLKIPTEMKDGILSYSFNNNPFIDQFQFFDEDSLDLDDEEIILTKSLKRFKRLKMFVNAFIERFA